MSCNELLMSRPCPAEHYYPRHSFRECTWIGGTPEIMWVRMHSFSVWVGFTPIGSRPVARGIPFLAEIYPAERPDSRRAARQSSAEWIRCIVRCYPPGLGSGVSAESGESIDLMGSRAWSGGGRGARRARKRGPSRARRVATGAGPKVLLRRRGLCRFQTFDWGLSG